MDEKPASPIVLCDQVSFSYPSSPPILQGVSFKIHKGEYIGIIGENGSGKSTLLKLILGLIPVMKGEIEVFSIPIRYFTEYEKIGYIPQNGYELLNKVPVTVREMIRSGFTGFHMPREKIEDLINEVIDRFELEAFAHSLFWELSGGQRQRTLLARAFVHDPELIILDEPTSGLDPRSRERLFSDLRKFKEEGKTIILISHDHERINQEADILYCLQECSGLNRNLKHVNHLHT